ncbi:MAG: RMD1 family protein [Deltaproteobacteria bacterium]|nr:RMD1 family protein [Deltaproteobacteria bacterium]
MQETEIGPTALLQDALPLPPLPRQETAAPEVVSYAFHAYHLAEALKLKEIAKLFELKPLVLNPTSLIYELSENCHCLFYHFGSVVFFNVEESVRRGTLDRLKEHLPSSATPVTSDEFVLEVEKKAKNTVFFEKVVIDKLNRGKVELIALVLAQSTALEYFENKVEAILHQLGDITSHLETSHLRVSGKKIRKFISQAMATQQSLISTLYLLEKPEETWENKILDDLHQEATMMFELKDRFRTVDYKLKMIQDNLEILSNFASNRQLVLLEWAIVWLIVLEVALFTYDLFLK